MMMFVLFFVQLALFGMLGVLVFVLEDWKKAPYIGKYILKRQRIKDEQKAEQLLEELLQELPVSIRRADKDTVH